MKKKTKYYSDAAVWIRRVGEEFVDVFSPNRFV